ncbi:MAG TPA: polysaccharide biosynthesis/export family protein [Candidatus Saccharimonadales bacterium]|nr:polysaccharide biosynthesis/export family protein [Candidatus Saccharimonadales bacterium]
MLNTLIHKMGQAGFRFIAGGLLLVLAGCESPVPVFHPPPQSASAMIPTTAAGQAVSNAPAANSNSLLLREGDSVHIAFPGAPTLDSTQTIRRDGKITLNMVGEITAAGLTPKDLEKELLKDYDSQLVVKQVSVTVQSSVFSVYVTGAVLRPGLITSERVLSPLDALIEAGIDHTKANLKSVTVIRQKDGGANEHFKLNLEKVLRGKPVQSFTLQPGDVIYVSEKFSWF